MQNTEEIIRRIILNHLSDQDVTITLETNLINDIGMDSISLMMMVVSIEDYFKIELPDEFLTEETLSRYSNIVYIVETLIKTNKTYLN